MAHYRIYKLSRDNLIVGRPEEARFESDQDVIEYVKTKMNGQDIEVWSGSRIVIRLNSTEK